MGRLSWRTLPAAVDVSLYPAAIDARLAELAQSEMAGIPVGVADAIRYALAGGGKRLRGRLVLAAYRAAGGAGDASALAAAVEVVHSYSLVHDDLPCMDDDAVRRGRATVHVEFGVAVATVAGIAMVPLAVAAAVRAGEGLGLPPGTTREIVRLLMVASGGGGMVGGQYLDLRWEGRAPSLETLERIHRGKTGSLIAAAAQVGGLSAGATPLQLEALESYGHALGLAFQIVDDVLDVTATSDQLGKTAGKDAAAAKATYPALLGIEGARRRAARIVSDGCDRLAAAGLSTPELEEIARFTLARRS
jgi:geranylgeranyl pyrophosphate synthase